MIPTMSIKRAAQIWSLSERRVNELCRTGRIEGAYKENGCWQLPANAKKPVDERYKVSLPPSLASVNAPLPIGVSDFKKVESEYYYIDKTGLIKDILDEKPVVSLFTRPRSFGKSLNLSMLKAFFEISDEDSSRYFRDKVIWQAGDKYRSEQGKYPVVSLDFRTLRYANEGLTFDRLRSIIIDEYDRHKDILESDRVSELDKEAFENIRLGGAGIHELRNSLMLLTKVLHAAFSEPPVVIIDEYDTPLVSAYENGYQEPIVDWFREFYTEGLSDNEHLSYCFMAGILNFNKTGIFTKVKNLKVNSVLDKRYGSYFGFLESEVITMIDYYNASHKEMELKNWYGTYHIGDADVYNPWSVISYFNDDCRPLAFWEMTGNNDVINTYLSGASLDNLEQLETMMQNKNYASRIDINITSPEDDDPSALYSYMLAEGYFTAKKAELQFDGDYMCEITLPNREMGFIFGKKILAQFESIIPKETAMSVREAIYRADKEELRKHIHNLIMHTVSFNAGDSDRIFYHGLVLGLCAMLGNRYHIITSQEAQTGNFAIEMMPLEINLPGILIQTKAVASGGMSQLEPLARFAVKQISNRQYDTEAKARYVAAALKYGVAYSGTAINVVME